MSSENKEQPPKIVPDVPIMRSMMVAPAAAPSLLRGASPTLKDPALQSTTQTTSKAQKAPATWDVAATITPLPPIYMLERTHTTVDAAPAVVAQRILDCLRRLSVYATYENTEALLEAETAENIKFTVRLWQKNTQQVIVEASKVDGCCFAYCQAVKAIFRAARGQAPLEKRQYAVPPCVPRDLPAEDSPESELAHAASMLQSPRLDSHVMGLETLLHLAKTNDNTARAIMADDNFRSTILTLVECHCLDRERAETPQGQVEQHYNGVLRRHALGILSRCLCASKALFAELTETSVLAALADDVSHAATRPHEACLAAQCLQALVAAGEPAVRAQVQSLALPALDAAQCCRHAALETACTQLRYEL